MKFPQQLKWLRIQHNYTQGEMAAILHMTQPVYSRYENGKIEPRSSLLLHISREFGVTLNWLLIGKAEKDLKGARIKR